MTEDGGQSPSTRDSAPRSLTEMRVATFVDSIILNDFGDRSPSATGTSRNRGAWEADTSRYALARVIEEDVFTERRTEDIGLHQLTTTETINK